MGSICRDPDSGLAVVFSVAVTINGQVLEVNSGWLSRKAVY